MKKINIIKKNEEFSNIMKNGDFIKNKYYLLYSMDKKEKYGRFGISIPKKIANATIRNKIKRQIKNIIDNDKEECIQKDKDYVIIIRKDLIDIEYLDRQIYLLTLFCKMGVKNEKN